MTILPMVLSCLLARSDAWSCADGVTIFLGFIYSWYLVSIDFNHTWIDISLTVLIPMGLVVAGVSLYQIFWVRKNTKTSDDWAELYWRIFWLCIAGVGCFVLSGNYSSDLSWHL
ncbi:MAG: hypothetical protein R3E55_15005 [Burkholderiaceae bacterium]